MADETVKIGIVAEDKTGPGVSSAKRSLDSLSKSATSAASGFNGLKIAAVGAAGAFAAIGVGAVATGIFNIGKSALQSYAEMERLTQSIGALTAKQALLSGSAATMEQALAQTKEESKELLQWIQKLAIESPFRQDDVANAFRLSMALGFNTAEAQRLTQAMLNFSTATGAGGETIERVNRALGQMKTKGKVSMEEINQLTEAGVDVMRILREATGKTGEALSKDIAKGLVGADAAIEAIIADTERLYAGAGAASANSMAGLLSTLEEMQEISGRNLLSGMFQELQGPLAAVVGIVSAPEFQAGITAWGEKLGSFTGDQLTGAADAIERIDAAIQPLLNQDAPGWLVALQGLMTAGDYQLKVNITPTVTSLETPDGGLKVDVEATAITITPGPDAEPIKLVANWQEGTIGSIIAAAQNDAQQESILLKAGWEGDTLAGLQSLIDSTQLWAKVNPLFVMAETSTAVTLWTANIGTQLATGIGDSINAFDWTAYQAKWQATFDTWKPAMTGLSEAGANLFASVQSAFNEPVMMSGSWNEGTTTDLFSQVQAAFSEPIMLTASWVSDALTSLWNSVQGFFSGNAISVGVNFSGGGSSGGGGGGGGGGGFGGGDGGSTQLSSTGRSTIKRNRTYTSPSSRAVGDGFFRGGAALVGELGPELAVLPRGTAIFNNSDTKSLFGGSLPRFAEGTMQIPPSIKRALGALGLWIPQGGDQMGPQTKAQSLGWKDFTREGTQAMQTAADRAGAAFEDTAKTVNSAFESALSSVPGLFDTSQVTGDQMRLAGMGVPQNFADDYVRRLSDEVLNGVDWEGVDIGDAAKRAGIDPNLPANVILELFKNSWNDSSLFANAQNLDLINQDAVKAAIEQQQKEMQGQVNIKALFGITDENMQQQSEQLGAGLASVFGGASESDAVKGAGVAVFSKVMEGFADPGTAADGVSGMASSIVSATGTPSNQAALYDAGEAGYSAYFRGWTAAANAAPITPPGGASGAGKPPGKAVGVGYWQGGWMQVHANETIYAPRGTSVRTANESARGNGATIINNVTINRQIDEEMFFARMSRRLRRAS